MMKHILISTKNITKTLHVLATLLLAVAGLSLTACSGGDYTNAVPSNSIALVSVDMAQIATKNAGSTKQLGLLKALLSIDDVGSCGIDVTQKLYLFESAEGNLGLVAKVSDDGDLNSWLNKMAKSGLCTKTIERNDCRFSTIKGSWIAGFNSTAVVVMGPVIAAQEAAVRQQIAKYIEQDEDYGLKASPLYDRLDSISTPIALVAQVAALPSKFAAPFTIGAPKQADASQILISAGITKGTTGCIEIVGTPFSLNKDIDKALTAQLKTLRPITQKYVGSMSTTDALGAFMNVDGRQFIELLHANKAFQALLAGINTAIDMDNIIKSIKGNMAIVMPQYSDNGTAMRMSATLGDRDFLADVPYWKQSCPKGGSITDEGKDFYCYRDGSMTYYFGVTADNQYYSGGTAEQAKQSISTAPKPLPQSVSNAIVGKRLCMVINIAALLGSNGDTKALLPLLKPLLGDANTVIYSVK